MESTRGAAGPKMVQEDSVLGNFEECPVCFTAFDDALQRPRTLPCGHTFCTFCVNELKEEGHATCPTCRVQHSVPEVGYFPVSYAVEGLIRRFKNKAMDSSPPWPEKDKREPLPSSMKALPQKGAAGISKTISSMLQEQESKLLATLSICQELEAELCQYKTTLREWIEQQQQSEDELQTLVDQSRCARVLVRQEESMVAAEQEQVQEGQHHLQVLLQELRSVATGQEAFEAITKADHLMEEESQRKNECQRMFPDVNIITTIRKTMMTSKAALNAAHAIETTECFPACAAREPDLLTDETSTTSEKIQTLILPLKKEDLHSLTSPIKRLLQNKRVFAVHQVEGKNRHSRISLENDQLLLYSLKNHSPPPGASILQMDKLVPASLPCLVFLDLAWPGSASRRVFIRLSPDTPLGQQFMLMCTGQRGPCYAGTVLFGTANKDMPGECVWGGDYEKNDGTGGAALLSNLAQGRYRNSGQAGVVFRVWRENRKEWNTRFGIQTKNRQGVTFGVFGEVEDGLETVMEAAHHSSIREVTVVECGIVLR